MLRIDVVTIFPKMFKPVLGDSILKRAQAAKRVKIVVHDLRHYTHDRHRTVDDRPYGGGAGMVMKPEPIYEAVEAIEARVHAKTRRSAKRCEIALLAAHGETFTQATAEQLATLEHLVLICGHYEGVDERVRLGLAEREISIGDYVLTGGEIPAMAVVDSVVRLVPGVLGHADATLEESFTNGLLEYPQYTRPVAFRGMDVPEVLRSGDHGAIAAWRKRQAMARTLTQRPDLVHDTRTQQE